MLCWQRWKNKSYVLACVKWLSFLDLSGQVALVVKGIRAKLTVLSLQVLLSVGTQTIGWEKEIKIFDEQKTKEKHFSFFLLSGRVPTPSRPLNAPSVRRSFSVRPPTEPWPGRPARLLTRTSALSTTCSGLDKSGACPCPASATTSRAPAAKCRWEIVPTLFSCRIKMDSFKLSSWRIIMDSFKLFSCRLKMDSFKRRRKQTKK